MDENELLEVKQNIEEAKGLKSEFIGRKKALIDNLKAFGLKDISAAKAKLDRLQKQIEDMNDQIGAMLNQLEEEMYGSDTDTAE